MFNKKTLILQIDINQGTQWGDTSTSNFIREVCIPSVNKYCLKYDYHHLLVKESIYEKQNGKFDFLATKSKHYSFERYFHLNNKSYDQIIYIDNDVFILDYAEPLPSIKGLMNAPEPDGNSSKIFREVNDLNSNQLYFNSGVTMCDQTTANHLSEYMLDRLSNYKRAKGKNTDNMMLNEYILDNKENFNILDNKWNYMPFLKNSVSINRPNFFHFVGIHGKQLVQLILKNKFEINDFIKKATFNH